ncbi:MAG TPA: LysR family transcriptional regulator, partial [Polyangia bacterium]|nr:LysR family transcriptional regulator [Polyangia bacterium]
TRHDWDDLRLFLAVFRAGSLGLAARRLGLDTSTVSRRLAGLEEELGASLFDRTRRGLVATRLAELGLPAVEAMEAAQGRFARDISGAERHVEGVVRLSVAPGLAQEFIAPLLVELHARHPGLRIEIDASQHVIDLSRHEADIALRSVPPEGADLLVTKLGTSRWIAVTGAKLHKTLGRLRCWEDAPWIGWDNDMASFHVARWLTKHAPKADILLRTSHFPSQLAAARSGLGVVLAPAVHAERQGLVPVEYTRALVASAAAWPSDDLWLVGRRALREVPRVAAVWQFLLAELRQL